MSGHNTQRDLEREPFLDMHAQIAKTPMLHDTDPTVLILDKPIFQNVPRTPEPAPVLPDLASNIRGPNRMWGGDALYTKHFYCIWYGPAIALGATTLDVRASKSQ